jgi:hypothetical protein
VGGVDVRRTERNMDEAVGVAVSTCVSSTTPKSACKGAGGGTSRPRTPKFSVRVQESVSRDAEPHPSSSPRDLKASALLVAGSGAELLETLFTEPHAQARRRRQLYAVYEAESVRMDASGGVAVLGAGFNKTAPTHLVPHKHTPPKIRQARVQLNAFASEPSVGSSTLPTAPISRAQPGTAGTTSTRIPPALASVASELRRHSNARLSRYPVNDAVSHRDYSSTRAASSLSGQNKDLWQAHGQAVSRQAV